MLDRVALDQQVGDLRPRERAEPALVGQRQGLGGAAEELLELEVEAEIAVIDRQPADRRARQRRAGRGSRRKIPAARSAAKVGYPASSSSAPSPPSTTVTCSRANRLSRCVGKIEASPNGSSSQPDTSGSSSYADSIEKVRSWWSVPRNRATARACRLSSKLASSKPIEKVRTSRAGSTSQSAAATLEESTPPERNTPSGTSERRCRATAARKSSQNRSAEASKSGAPNRSGRRLPVAARSRCPGLPDQDMRPR